MDTQKTERNFDFVFCIDCSAGMADHLATVREKVKTFYPEFIGYFIEQGDSVQSCRCKIIGFRNYEMDGQEAMFQSQWFDVSDGHDEELDACLNGLQARGGGVDRNSGIEALFYAMTTDWNTKGDKDRQVIVLFTDADAVTFCSHTGHPNYPTDMVDMDGLLNTWMGVRPAFMGQGDYKLKERCKRMVLFAPAGTIYETMMSNFNRCQFIPVQMNAGFGAIDWKDIF